MRASTLFAITLSLLLGLGAAAGARYAGLFDRKEAPPEPEKQVIKILVARANLFEDVVVSADQVMIRDLRPEEEQDYRSKPEKYMPALTMSAHQRVPKRNIVADTPLLREYFEDAGLPEQLSRRLEPGTRSVNIGVLKDKAAGGVIRVGEYVDVLLSSSISAPGSADSSIQTACIARACKVIMKRNSLYQMMQGDPDGQPMYFGLQANPYRAALIEFASRRGSLSLMPVPAPSRRISSGAWSDPTSREYADEDQRVDLVNRGEYSISDRDLERIFNLIPPPPPTPPIMVRHIVGTTFTGQSVFPNDPSSSGLVPAGGSTPSLPQGSSLGGRQASGGFSFATSDEDAKKCKTCGNSAKK